MTVVYPLWFALLSAECLFFGMLVCRHVYPVLPVFTLVGASVSVLGVVSTLCAVVWPLCCDSLLPIGILLRALLWLCLTIEIGRNLLRSNRATAPLLPFCFLLFLGMVAALLLMMGWRVPASFSPSLRLSVFALKSAGATQLAAFLALTWWALLRHFAWTSIEFRLAAGIGVQSFACLIAGSLLSDRFLCWSQWLLWFPEVVYLLVLLRWMVFFERECSRGLLRASTIPPSLEKQLSHAEKIGF